MMKNENDRLLMKHAPYVIINHLAQFTINGVIPSNGSDTGFKTLPN